MNAKTCKKIRNFLRRRHIDPTQALYVPQSRRNLTTLCLDPRCGRAQYQSSKKPLLRA